MNNLLTLLKTFRPLNLLFMALSMLLARHFLVLPVLNDAYRMGSSLDEWQFALLVLATIFIAAAGYLINDHLDRATDSINRPGKNPVGISPKNTEVLYVALNVIGISLGTAAALLAGNYKLGWIFVGASGLLYLYSNKLKKIPLAGNIVVSSLTGISVLNVAIFETGLFNGDPVASMAAHHIWYAVGAYALFAFLINLVREIVKDTEDMQGDAAQGRRTLPIVAGETPAKFAAIFLLLLLFRMLLAVQKKHILDEGYIFLGYIAILVELPSLVAMVLIYRADRIKHYTRISVLLKLIMLAGMLSMPLYQVLI
jgi:4-hydroxybenzoate polyprenyltransferase